MVDECFFSYAGPLGIADILIITKSTTNAEIPSTRAFKDVASLSSAQADHISFLDNKKYVSELETTQAGACLIHPKHASRVPPGTIALETETPYLAFALLASAFHPEDQPAQVIHPTATIADDCSLSDDVTVGPGAVLEAGVEIGQGTVIGANTVVHRNVKIGKNGVIGSNTSLQCCFLGDKVIIHPGVRIGQDGFGYALGPEGHAKVPQLGRVIVEDHVEIGANTTIDRGAGPDTVIGAGSKIDNLVQIGHNVKIGRGCVVVSQVGISGSTEIGDFVVIGGQTGLAGHLKIGDGVQIAAKSGIMRDIKSGATVGGIPAQPMKDWLRSVALIERMTKTRQSR